MTLHYRRDNPGNPPRCICGRTEGPETTVDPPRNSQGIREEHCGNCVRLLKQSWEKGPSPTPKPLRHIRMERDPLTTICGKSATLMDPPPLPYPDRLPPPEPGWCRMCRTLWERQERYRREQAQRPAPRGTT